MAEEDTGDMGKWFWIIPTLIVVIPLTLIPPKITALLHWADPFFSLYFIG